MIHLQFFITNFICILGYHLRSYIEMHCFKNTFYHMKAFSFQWWHLRAYNTAILLLCSPHLHQKYIFYLCVLFRQNTAKNLLCLHMNSDVVVVLCIICINWYIYFIRIIYLIFWTITELMQPIKKYSGPKIIT